MTSKVMGLHVLGNVSKVPNSFFRALTETYTGKDVMKSKSVQPVNILHYDGGKEFSSLSKPFFLNCIYFNPMGKSPAGPSVTNT